MSDVSGTPSKPIEGDLRLITALVYGLFLFSLPTHGFSALVGVVIAYVKRGDARGTAFQSHFSNAITVFWASIIFWVLLAIAAIAGVAGVMWTFGPDVWHWHAHDWTAQMHQWRAQLQDHQIPQGWWPAIAFLPLVPISAFVFALWYLYRVIRGLVHALENKPY
jgi:uncharacterized membrane protein